MWLMCPISPIPAASTIAALLAAVIAWLAAAARRSALLDAADAMALKTRPV
jgi:hypothetical protein